MAKTRKTVNNGKSTGGRNAQGQFAKGNPGRPSGTPNKVNAALKDDILEAYDERGGFEWLRGLKCLVDGSDGPDVSEAIDDDLPLPD